MKKNIPIKDDRLTVYHFTQRIDGFNDLRKQDILWPCATYKACIPVYKVKPLNIFEETILRLTDVLTGDTKQLADVSCMDMELVQFIQNRLFRLRYLDNRFAVTDIGKSLISCLEKEPELKHFQSVTVFKDLVNGQWLPYVALEPLQNCDVGDITRDTAVFYYGNKNKQRRVHAYKINPVITHCEPPRSEDVIHIITQYRGLCKRRALTGNPISGKIPMFQSTAVVVSPEEAKRVYLHCMVVRHNKNDAWLVTEGFSGHFSAGFGAYIITQDFGWMHHMIKERIVEKADAADSDKPVKNQPLKHRYPNINSHLIKAEDRYNEAAGIVAASTFDDERIKKSLAEAAKRLYDAMEHTLRHVADRYPVDDLNRFITSSKRENKEMLVAMARKIGLAVEDEVSYLFQVEASRFRNPQAEMTTGLALVVTGAARDIRHPMLTLAANEPNLLQLLSDLHSLRVQHSHGKPVEVNAKWFENAMKRVHNAIHTLIPDYIPHEQPEGGTQASGFMSSGDYEQIRLRAEDALYKNFTIPIMYGIPRDVRASLFEAEMLRLEHAGDPQYIQTRINHMSGALQNMITACLSTRVSLYDIGDSPKRDAYTHALEAGFTSVSGDVFMPALETVAHKNIAAACRNATSTLGGVMLAMCLIYQSEELKSVAQKAPGLIETCAALLNHRVHGNQSILNIAESEMSTLWDGLVNAIKALKE